MIVLNKVLDQHTTYTVKIVKDCYGIDLSVSKFEGSFTGLQVNDVILKMIGECIEKYFEEE